MKIATYNVNSVNARMENLLRWLAAQQPDVALLQEIKSTYENFPAFELRAAGYNVEILGQKSYNGVAILSRHKIKVTQQGLPEFEDENARYLEAEIAVNGMVYKVASIYLPNGNPPYNKPDDDSKLCYKLKWMDAFCRRAAVLAEERQPVILGGDFNVIMTDNDVYDPAAFRSNALFLPEVVRKLKAFSYLGYYDAFRILHQKENGYTFWDYTGAALRNDMGMRIDYLWLNAYAVDRLESCRVDKTPRLSDKPSDHTVLEAVLR